MSKSKEMQAAKGTKLTLGTVRGWISGSRAGTPTFVLYLSGTDSYPGAPIKRLATPAVLLRWLESFDGVADDKARLLSADDMYDFSSSRFGYELEAWSTYAQLLLEHPLVEQALHDERTDADVIIKFAQELVIGCLAHDGTERGYEMSWWSHEAEDVAVAALGLTGQGDDSLALIEQVKMGVSDASRASSDDRNRDDWRGAWGIPMSALGPDVRHSASAFPLARETVEALGYFQRHLMSPSAQQGQSKQCWWAADGVRHRFRNAANR